MKGPLARHGLFTGQAQESIAELMHVSGACWILQLHVDCFYLHYHPLLAGHAFRSSSWSLTGVVFYGSLNQSLMQSWKTRLVCSRVFARPLLLMCLDRVPALPLRKVQQSLTNFYAGRTSNLHFTGPTTCDNWSFLRLSQSLKAMWIVWLDIELQVLLIKSIQKKKNCLQRELTKAPIARHFPAMFSVDVCHR